MGFWDLAEALLADPVVGGAAESARLRASNGLLDTIQRELAREVGRNVHARGSLYVAAPDPQAVASLLEALPPVVGPHHRGLRVHVLASRAALGATAPAHPLVESIAVDPDGPPDERRFLLFLSDRGAYGALRSAEGELFHTCDAPLVDVLIAKLLEHHHLRSAEGT